MYSSKPTGLLCRCLQLFVVTVVVVYRCILLNACKNQKRSYIIGFRVVPQGLRNHSFLFFNNDYKRYFSYASFTNFNSCIQMQMYSMQLYVV